MNFRSSKLHLVLVLAVAFVAAAWIYFTANAGDFLAGKLKSACTSCRLSFRDSYLSPAFGKLVYRDFSLKAKDGSTLFHVKCKEIELVPVRSSMLSREIRLARIILTEPEVEIIDLPKEPNDHAQSRETQVTGVESKKVLIEQLELKDGLFIYAAEIPGKNAKLRISKIQALGNSVTFGGRGQEEKMKIDLEALIENQGALNFKLAVSSFSGPADADIDLHIRDLDLALTNGYFERGEHIKLEGRLEDGHAEMNLRDRKVTGKLHAVFRDLDVEALPGPDRGSFGAFILSRGLDLKLKSKNKGKSDPKDAKISTTHRASETLVQFLLRAMKEAAINVAS